MERTTLTITTRAQLETAFRFAAKQQYPYIVEVRDVKRTDEQNRTMWLWLAAFEEQAELSGKRFSKEQWKVIFLQALGKELEVLPTLDGKSWFPAGFRSSKLTKFEFMDLLTLIDSEAAKRGVKLPITEESEAAETEGAASDQPAADPPSVREPAHPGELIRTREGAMEYARRWAAFYLTVPHDQQDIFIEDTQALINLAQSLNPDSYPVFKEAVNPSKGKAA